MKPPSYGSRPSLLQYWFPLLLGFLLLLCVPGALLLLLHLLGQENAVNGWMQKNFSLSYHIAIPWWAALVLLLMPFFIALLYFLKLKRKPIQVPSTFLWKKSIEDMHVNAFFQWLRQNMLLLLQVLIVLFLIYGVMAFQVHGSTKTGKYYILMIDSSASMSVGDGTPTRLDAAKQAAFNEINAHAENDVGMVIEFNSAAAICQPYTSDRGLLRLAVEKIMQTQRVTRINDALDLADSLANPRQSTDNNFISPSDVEPGKERTYVMPDGIVAEVHLFSDGRFPDVAEFAAGNLDLKYHRVGKAGPEQDNVGIVNFSASRDEQAPGKVQVFVRVLNFRPSDVETRVELEVRGKNPADYKRYVQPADGALRLPARSFNKGDAEKDQPAIDKPGEGIVTFELTDIDDSDNVTLHASLMGNKDAFKLDDETWLVIGVVRKARICIVTPGNELLHTFFDQEAMAKVANVTYLAPADLTDEAKYKKPARDGGFDLVIFDRCAPATEETLPLSNTFFIADVPPPWKRADLKPLEDTLIRNTASKHPLMRHLTGLDEIAFTEAFLFNPKDLPLPPRTPRLLETGKETAAMLALARRSYTDVVMTFPLINNKGEWCTTWPLKLSFPIFLRNVLYTLGNVSDAAAEPNVQPGELMKLRPGTIEKEIEVYNPDNPESHAEQLKRSNQGDFVYKNTEHVGVYKVQWQSGQRRFAVNLLDAEESNIQPRDDILIGDITVKAGQERGSVRETWKWGAVAALVLVLLEYALYHRRVFG
jgi:von Willebrand factor type A domain/Aerotolerance regulator N-terminal